MTPPSKIALYARTVARMRPGMVASRLRPTRLVPDTEAAGRRPAAPLHIAIPELDCDAAYAARFDVDALGRGEFLLINERHAADLSRWQAPEASHLWNFNLHYFEHCVPLAARYSREGDPADYERFRRLVRSWMAGNPYPEGDGWHPYTISLRLVNWLICADLFGGAFADDAGFQGELCASMYRQYRHLLANQETHLLANHYFENLKTLLICSALFGERSVHDRVRRDFEGQLDEQVLPDGVHYERSPMYQKLLLEGLLRVRVACDQSGLPAPDGLDGKARAMLDAACSLERGMGRTPAFNDSADGVAKPAEALAAAAARVLGASADDSILDFPDAGYFKLYDADAAVMFDAGEAGPSYMLGHAHCDALSYELSLGGVPVAANCGTYAYQSGLRPWFRSTAAHNTAVVGGEEQLECWAEHRVGRGYRLVECVREGNAVEATIKLPSGRLHRRRVELAGRELRVVDAAEGDAPVASHVHLLRPDLVELALGEGCSVERTEADFSPAFGVLGRVADYVVTGRGSASYVLRFVGGEA